MVAMTIQAVVTPQARLFRFGGLSNWGVTPSGGARAGAASSSSRDAGGIAMSSRVTERSGFEDVKKALFNSSALRS